MSALREKIKEIVELIALVPEQFKNQCFEILLKEAIEECRQPAANTKSRGPNSGSNKKSEMDVELEPKPDPLLPEKKLEDQITGQTDVVLSDLHMKARRFIEKQDISVEQLNNLFYKEGDSIMSLVEDYGTTKVSEAQMRIAMFQSLRNSLETGEFVTTVEAVRAECKDRKSYDQTNFSGNFRNNTALFDFDTFSKDVTDLRLSEEGKKTLAAFIKTLN